MKRRKRVADALGVRVADLVGTWSKPTARPASRKPLPGRLPWALRDSRRRNDGQADFQGT
jgi:hypothetical protein